MMKLKFVKQWVEDNFFEFGARVWTCI